MNILTGLNTMTTQGSQFALERPLTSSVALPLLRQLRKIEIELTSECIVGRRSRGKGCLHCSLKAGTGKSSYLDGRTVVETLKDAAQLGATVVVFTGGEPSQHPDFVDLLSDAKALGLSTRVYTTGVNGAWPPGKLRAVSKLVDEIYLSVEGMGPSHDAVLGLEGAFDETMAFAAEARALNLRWVAHFTPMRVNHQDLAPLAYKLASLGASALKLIDFVPQGRGHTNQGLLELSPREYFDLFTTVRELQSRLNAPDGSPFVRFHDETYGIGSEHHARLGKLSEKGCTSGRESCAILSDGSVIPCLGFRMDAASDGPRSEHIVGNVYATGFRGVWLDSPLLLKFSRSRSVEVNPKCAKCSLADVCVGCCSCRRSELEAEFSSRLSGDYD